MVTLGEEDDQTAGAPGEKPSLESDTRLAQKEEQAFPPFRCHELRHRSAIRQLEAGRDLPRHPTGLLGTSGGAYGSAVPSPFLGDGTAVTLSDNQLGRFGRRSGRGRDAYCRPQRVEDLLVPAANGLNERQPVRLAIPRDVVPAWSDRQRCICAKSDRHRNVGPRRLNRH